MAYRLKASQYVKNCPVSDNAYFSFVQRIMTVVQGVGCQLMVEALNKYLEGDRFNYADKLDEHLTRTFEMLRFEIEKAIERSTRARARVKTRVARAKNTRQKASKLSDTSKRECAYNAENKVTPLFSHADSGSVSIIDDSVEISADRKKHHTESERCVAPRLFVSV